MRTETVKKKQILIVSKLNYFSNDFGITLVTSLVQMEKKYEEI